MDLTHPLVLSGPVRRTIVIDPRSDTLSWPHMFVPSLAKAASFLGYMKWWKNYLTYFTRLALRASHDTFFKGAEVVLGETILSWILFTIGYSTTIRNNKLQAIIDAMDLGGGTGTEKWYDGVRPATGGSITTLLGTLTLSTTAATKSGGVLTFNAIANDVSADATSTVTWGRIQDSTPTFCFDHSIGTAGGNDIVVNTAAIVTGAVLSITSWTITDGNP